MHNQNINNFISRIILQIFFISAIFSQTDQEPLSDGKSGKVYYIQPASLKPLIDGVLDDPVWRSISPITDFVQEEPNNMAEPSEKTEVYLTYDDQALYVAARMYDSAPSDIVRQLAPRDDWYGAFDEMSDWFSIDLDSHHDHQTGFSFAVNASGVISDEMVYHDKNFDSDWNAIWQAEIHIDDLGWSLEMEIPFSNLPFYEGGEFTWGINLTRFIQRKYETITWVAFPLDVGGVVSKYGHLNGLKGIYPPAKFEFKPYSMAGLTNYSDIQLKDYNVPYKWNENYTNDPHQRLGLDFKYRINPNSQLTFTINPDFGQVELDPANVNLTSYETYFQEKRPFFLKNTDIFETPIEIFYSRRIGDIANIVRIESFQDTLLRSDFGNCESISGSLTESLNINQYYGTHSIVDSTVEINQGIRTIVHYKAPVDYVSPIIFKGASKFTGKTKSGLSYGLLGAVTTLNDSSGWTDQMMKGENRNYFVSRIKQDLFAGNSFVGLMTTSSMADSAHTFSVDGMTNFLENRINIDGQIIMTSSKQRGLYGNISFSPPGYFSTWLEHHKYDKGLNLNHLGYLWRDDYTQTKVGIKLQTLESWSVLRNAAVIIEGDMEENSLGLDLGKTIVLSYDIQFVNSWAFGGGIYKMSEAYDDREISLWEENIFGPPVLIPEVSGTYLNISSNMHQSIAGSMNLTWAKNTRNDMEREQLIEMTYTPNPFINFSISYDHYQRKKKYDYTLDSDPEWNYTLCTYIDTHYIFSSINEVNDQLTLRMNWNLNRKLTVQAYMDYYSILKKYDKNSYTEYNEKTDEFDSTKYIWGGGDYAPFYTEDEDKIYNSAGYMISLLDPNYYIYNYPKFKSLIFNGVIKWNYMKGSNIYFVFSFNKSVNGTSFYGIDGLRDFLKFNSKKRWVEVLRDQTFMIKVDYWFEK